MTTFYLIRHAVNDYLGRAIAGRLPNVHLNAEGQGQAERLAAGFDLGVIERIFSSPMDRCLETAAPLARRFGLKMEIDPGLNELDFGDWTDGTLAELSEQTAWKRWHAFRSGARMPGGERMIEVQARAVVAIHALAEQFREGKLALVTHADVVRALLLYYLGSPLDFINRVEITPASVSALTLTEDSVQVLCVNRCW